MKNLKISGKFILSFAIILALMLILGIASLLAAVRLSSVTKVYAEQSIPAVKEKVLHLNVTDCTALSRSLIRRQSRDSVRRALEETSGTTETS